MQVRREEQLKQLADGQIIWDLIVVGGGATGLGAAVDAASRGFKTLLLEQADFAKGTSSRSTKLVHGGVRYLAQGNIGLVREALRERGLLLKNAPHLVRNESFIIPNYNWWGGAFYTIGLTLYDLLAGKLSLGRSRYISRKEVLRRLSNINPEGLQGGVLYHDGQFDDSRLAVNLAQTCLEQQGHVINYVKVTGLIKDRGQISGVTAVDTETGISYSVNGRTVINATGVFVDELLRMDVPGSKPLVRPSQGIHLVLDKSFLGSGDALMIPRTEDGRVLFAVPWHDKTVLGTTDTPLDEYTLEPVALEEEVQFILRTAAKYLVRAPERGDVLSVYAGLRPLAAPQTENAKTKEISRSHKLIVSASGLITITGGKWTTYRQMGEDTVDQAMSTGKLTIRNCITKTLPIHGHQAPDAAAGHLSVYGSDRDALRELIQENAGWQKRLHPQLDYTAVEVIWAVRQEMARTIEDVLARRTRALFLNARAAIEMAPEVARLMSVELKKDAVWEKEQIVSFGKIAEGYLLRN
ncbi:MAG: glycerol-3-phosphate dehydrogenase/oxidase [Bacteroidota bacterium]|nr:glycerol-3-phosphate dehydrogenase/oxidase [Bacteroidota bacterium]